jgi:hypothetical protein
MRILRSAASFALILVVSVRGQAASQQTSASASVAHTRTAAIVASFNKSKHVTKEKHGVRKEKYKEIRSEAVVRSDPRTYSGTYEVQDLGLTLNLRLDQNGRGEGTGDELVGQDPSVKRHFRLVDTKVEGALLTGTKLYADGTSDRLEGVFLNQTTFESPTDKGVTRFGIGMLGKPVHIDGVTVDKLFYELRR